MIQWSLLKKFQNSKNFLPNGAETCERGVLIAFAQGVELTSGKVLSEILGLVESLVLYPSEIDRVACFIRIAAGPNMPASLEWVKERATNPSFIDWIVRANIIIYYMVDKQGGLGGKEASSIGSSLTELIQNAWVPYFEKSRGYQAVVERKTKDGIFKQTEILANYLA